MPALIPESVSASDNFGIVVNETFTPAGQEFYRRFTDFWREKPDFESYTLVIVERPSHRFGNRVTINFEQKAVYSGNLPVKFDQIRSVSSDSVEKVYANIISLSLRTTGSSDPDLAGSGF